VCDDAADTCVTQPKVDGTACDDNLFCTVNDQCIGGGCAAGPARDCSTVGDQCNDGVCDDAADTCAAQPKVDGTACDDNLFCSEIDTCQNGFCRGSDNPCTSSCDENNDVCIDLTTSSTTTTILSVTTTTTIPVNPGECTSDMQCDDNNECTADACIAGLCERTPVINGTECDDGKFCTENDVCQNGVCLGFANPCHGNENYCDGVEFCKEDLDDYLCTSTGNPCEPLSCQEFDDFCEGSTVTLTIGDVYGHSGIIQIILENDFDYISEAHFDVCNADQYAWLLIDVISCHALSSSVNCGISDLGDGCVRIDLVPVSNMIDPRTGIITEFNYSIEGNLSPTDSANLIIKNITILDDNAVSLSVTPKPGKVGISPPEATNTTTSIPSTTTITDPLCPVELLYGEYAEETEFLRMIRDTILIRTEKGLEIIKQYYEWSPIIVKAMEEDEAFKKEVKELVDGVLELITEEVE
jgi:hypothetical protein